MRRRAELCIGRGLIIGLLLMTSGCHPFWIIMTEEPAGTPEYKLGWEDGCDTGVSAEGGWDDKLMFGFKKRPEMSANDQYKQGWNEGFTHCRFAYAQSHERGNWSDIGLGGGTGSIHGGEEGD